MIYVSTQPSPSSFPSISRLPGLPWRLPGGRETHRSAGEWGGPTATSSVKPGMGMENGPFIDGLPIKNGDFPWLC